MDVIDTVYVELKAAWRGSGSCNSLFTCVDACSTRGTDQNAAVQTKLIITGRKKGMRPTQLFSQRYAAGCLQTTFGNHLLPPAWNHGAAYSANRTARRQNDQAETQIVFTVHRAEHSCVIAFVHQSAAFSSVRRRFKNSATITNGNEAV